MDHQSNDHPKPLDDSTVEPLHVRLTQCVRLMATGDYGRCTSWATSLHDEAMAAADHGAAAKASLLLAKVHANQSQYDQACAWADAAIRAATSTSDASLQAEAWMVKGAAAAASGQPALAIQQLNRALAVLGERPQDDVANTVFTGVGLTYMAMGMPVQALAAHRKALEAARTALVGTQLRMRVNLLYSAGAAYDLLRGVWQDEADQVIDSVRGDVEQIARDAQIVGSAMARAGHLHSVGALLRRIGRADEACQMLTELCTLLPQIPRDVRHEALIDLALAQRAAGLTAEASSTMAAAREVLPPIDDMQPRAEALRYASQVAKLEGRPAEALALFQRYHSVVVRNEHAAFDARMAEMGATVHMLSLRHENAELRRRNDGLSESYSQATTLAATDPLTGVGNRRALEAAYAAFTSAGRTLSLLMLDLDHFKSINDRHSHLVGDRVLREVATVMGHTLRDGDFLGRYGGEEFTVLLAGAEMDTALQVAERLRVAVESADWAALAPGLKVTLSGGVVQVRDGEDFNTAIGRGDDMLYRAKRGGRNRTVGEPSLPSWRSPT